MKLFTCLTRQPRPGSPKGPSDLLLTFMRLLPSGN
jgi:hypothetical protein